MSNPPIPPALTEEEWTGVRLGDLDIFSDIDGGKRAQVALDTGEFTNPPGVDIDNTRLIGSQRHMVAALCLYDQSYGFTPEDVDVLTVAMDKHGIHVASLIARIAALLPPQLVSCGDEEHP